PARPAFRDLLLPGHRLLPARRPAPLRARRAGRAQGRARFPARAHAQPPLRCRSRLRARAAPVVRGRTRRRAALSRRGDGAFALPPRRGSALMGLAILDPAPDAPFPPTNRALRDPDGLLAAGGDLSPTRLLNAYRQGIFPWFNEGDPILWWTPDPR